MKKRLLGLLAFTTFIVATQAQVTFGPKAGLNLAKISGDDTEDVKMKMGAQIGILADIAFSDALSLQTGLLFSQKGAKEEYEYPGETITDKYNLNYLELPINFVVGIGSGDNKFQLLAGPYFSYGIGGKVKSDEENAEDIDIQFVSDLTDADEDKVPFAPFDIGVNIGAGYKISNFQIQANYGLGLANLYPKLDGEKDEDKITNGVIQLSVAYFFGGN